MPVDTDVDENCWRIICLNCRQRERDSQKARNAEWMRFTAAVTEHFESLMAVRNFLATEQFDAAREAWREIPQHDQQSIWRAYTKGGFFTTREVAQMRYWSNDFNQTRKSHE